ncbi:hypothetical protein FACS18949_07860 [Clostridia bacterium]|nr:hypothetical protein FACS18949_07860 [Clostridia bacterium]
MKLNTTRFGDIDIAEEKIVHFADGLPGLEDLKRYALITTEETEPFHWFQSIDARDIALAVIDPYRLFPKYAIKLPETVLEELDLGDGSGENLLVLTVAVVPQDFRAMTTNLVSPIIINSEKNLGRQVILENSDYLIRQPIYDLLQEYVIREGAADAGSDA